MWDVWDAGIETLKTEQRFNEHHYLLRPSKFRHCKTQTITEHPPMTSQKSQTSFRARIESYSARHIANAIGCSLPTAYDWRSGRRAPPPWLHDRYVIDLAAYHPQIKHTD